MKKEKAAKPLPIGVVPNPKAKLLDQVREVIQVKRPCSKRKCSGC